MAPEPASLEVSAPVHDAHGLRFATVHSAALGGRGDVCLYQAGEAEVLPVIVLLHGVYGSAWSWPLQGSAHVSLAAAVGRGEIPPCLLVTPSDGLYGLGSGYLPLAHGDYEGWIMRDLLMAVRQMVPQATGSLYLGGLSMGGFGALRLGAKYASEVAGIAAHSSITKMDDFPQFLNGLPHDFEVSSEECDLLHWIRQAGEALPPLQFDCGVDDPLLESNRAFHSALHELGAAHEYYEHAGAHEWDYWSRHVADAYRFFGSIEANVRRAKG